MKVLAIETSCDETAAAIVEYTDGVVHVLTNTVSSQASLHAKWGGVVPDLASREHIRNIIPVIEETLKRASLGPTDIDLLAVTEGPGLMPALLIGVSAAKILSLIWEKPLIGINHLEGHIYANLLGSGVSVSQGKQTPVGNFTFPLLALIVSGGHTELVLMRGHFQYEVLGETQDDAAGEAFDKVAKLLGLSYPGGPIVAKRADDFRLHLEPEQPSLQISFPRPMIDSDNYHFSFSGLKTSVLYFVKKNEGKMNDERFLSAVCHEFQEAVVDVLVAKTKKALIEYAPATLVIAGGVSANVRLRERLQTLTQDDFPYTEFLTPEFTFSLDNAAMIGSAAALRYERMDEKSRTALWEASLTLEPNANLPLCDLDLNSAEKSEEKLEKKLS